MKVDSNPEVVEKQIYTNRLKRNLAIVGAIAIPIIGVPLAVYGLMGQAQWLYQRYVPRFLEDLHIAVMQSLVTASVVAPGFLIHSAVKSHRAAGQRDNYLRHAETTHKDKVVVQLPG